MYTPRTKPRAHQVEAQRRLALRPPGLDVMAWLMEMGTGKSKIILDEWGARVTAGDLDGLLIIAPAGSYRNWDSAKTDLQLSEFEAHLDPELYKRMVVATWTSSSSRNVGAKDYLKKFLLIRNRPRVLLVNIEALSSVKAAGQLCESFLTSGRVMMVIDESTVIRNAKANRTKLILKLGHLAVARRILTGLVTPKSPLDLFHQFEFLDWHILGFESLVAFRARYARVKYVCFLPNEALRSRFRSACGLGKNLSDGLMRNKLKTVYPGRKAEAMTRMAIVNDLEIAADGLGRNELLDLIPKLGGWVQSVPKIDGYQNLEEIQAKIAPYSYRVLKEDCLDLPPKIYQRRDVALTKEQERIYGELLEFATSEIKKATHITATNVLAQMIKLHQLVCGYGVDDVLGDIYDVPSNRIDELLKLLAEHGGKATIWVTYQHTLKQVIDRLVEEYGQGAVAAYHGGNRPTRLEDEKRFLGDPECRFMVATQAAGGRGNTWVNASLVVYFANTYDLEMRLQSEDRHHRDGLKHAVTYVDLVAPGTVDEKIIHALRTKIDLATAITGENYRQWLI